MTDKPQGLWEMKPKTVVGYYKDGYRSYLLGETDKYHPKYGKCVKILYEGTRPRDFVLIIFETGKVLKIFCPDRVEYEYDEEIKKSYIRDGDIVL
jgi:hypothetical protein